MSDLTPAAIYPKKLSIFYIFFGVYQEIEFILWRKTPQKTIELPSVVGKIKYSHKFAHSCSIVEPTLHMKI
jgi:hypothetical protein